MLNMIKIQFWGLFLAKSSFLGKTPIYLTPNILLHSFWNRSICIFESHRYSNNIKITGEIISCG